MDLLSSGEQYTKEIMKEEISSGIQICSLNREYQIEEHPLAYSYLNTIISRKL